MEKLLFDRKEPNDLEEKDLHFEGFSRRKGKAKRPKLSQETKAWHTTCPLSVDDGENNDGDACCNCLCLTKTQ